MADLPVPPPADPAMPAVNQPALQEPAVSQAHAGQQPLNWSHFRPGFAGELEEDVEAHLLFANDWMNTHNFPGDVKVQRFCLTLVGEARLWYESLRPIAMIGQHYRNSLGNSIPRKGIQENSYFMH